MYITQEEIDEFGSLARSAMEEVQAAEDKICNDCENPCEGGGLCYRCS